MFVRKSLKAELTHCRSKSEFSRNLSTVIIEMSYKPSTQNSSDPVKDSPSIKSLQDDIKDLKLRTSKSSENQILKNSNNELEVAETKSLSPRGSHPNIDTEEDEIKGLKKSKTKRRSITKPSWITLRPRNLMIFESRGPQRQHAFGNTPYRQLPPPPSYYPANQDNRRNQQQHSNQNHEISFNRMAAPQLTDLSLRHAFINPHYWIPYPPTIPPNIPPCLAQLLEVDALFVIKNFEILELITGLPEPEIYLIQNKNGECIFYAYEISNFLSACCCGRRRDLQLVIKDAYHNEVIFMNKYCGCIYPCFYCCYPVMEVYAPPSVPIGAVTRVCRSCRDDYVILDANENKMFNIRGSVSGNFFPRCSNLSYSIHALDRDQTVVGYIKRQFGDFRTYTLNAEVCGISFPANLDVRLKSVFLGVLFLVEIMYYS